MNVMTSSLLRMQQAEHMMRGRLAEATVSLLLFLQYVEPKVVCISPSLPVSEFWSHKATDRVIDWKGLKALTGLKGRLKTHLGTSSDRGFQELQHLVVVRTFPQALFSAFA